MIPDTRTDTQTGAHEATWTERGHGPSYKHKHEHMEMKGCEMDRPAKPGDEFNPTSAQAVKPREGCNQALLGSMA